MRLANLYGPSDIRLEEAPEPTISAPTDAIIEVAASCICGSDLWPYRGENPIHAPQAIGHEMIGRVAAVGNEVSTVREGDFVVVPFCHSDNTCPHCLAGMQSACVNVGFTTGGQSEFGRVTQADGSLVKVADEPDKALWASLLALSDVMPTGWHAAMCARVSPGDTVVVVGDGAVGLCGVLAAKALGAERVIAMSRNPDRQRVAREFGATEIIAERGDEGVSAVREITGGVGADAVLECVGTDDAMKLALKVARPGAMVGYVGVPHGVQLNVGAMFARNVGITGGIAPVRAYLPDLLERVLTGTLDPSPVFDRRVGLSEVADGYRAMDSREAIKVYLDPTV